MDTAVRQSTDGRRSAAALDFVRTVLALEWPAAIAVLFCGLVGFALPAAAGLMAGVPEPGVHDEFAYLLNADTFAHGRLANPSPALPEFFEVPHVLVAPTYAAKYPPGQGLLLALGQVATGEPISGVWLSCGLFAAALCWMLIGWTSTPWALAATMMAVSTLGVSSYWAQSYWGGMPSAFGSALLFGGLRRTWRTPTVVSSLLLGLGILTLANTRPYDGLLVCVPAAAVLGWWLLRLRTVPWRTKATSVLLPLAIVLAIGGLLMGIYNAAVTGHWLKMPYAAHESQYSEQDVFLFSSYRVPERRPIERIAGFYRASADGPVRGWLLPVVFFRHFTERLPLTIETGLGILDAPGSEREPYRGLLLWVLPFALLCARRPWGRFCLVTVIFATAGISLVRWWLPHYSSALVPLVVASITMALSDAMRANGSRYARWTAPFVILLAVTYVAAPFVIRRLPGPLPATSAATSVPSAPPVSYATRAGVRRQLEALEGLDLVLVAYADGFSSQRGEWVYNGADLKNGPVVFAHDLGRVKNRTLIDTYPQRTVWRALVSETEVLVAPYDETAP